MGKGYDFTETWSGHLLVQAHFYTLIPVQKKWCWPTFKIGWGEQNQTKKPAFISFSSSYSDTLTMKKQPLCIYHSSLLFVSFHTIKKKVKIAILLLLPMGDLLGWWWKKEWSRSRKYELALPGPACGLHWLEGSCFGPPPGKFEWSKKNQVPAAACS